MAEILTVELTDFYCRLPLQLVDAHQNDIAAFSHGHYSTSVLLARQLFDG